MVLLAFKYILTVDSMESSSKKEENNSKTFSLDFSFLRSTQINNLRSVLITLIASFICLDRRILAIFLEFSIEKEINLKLERWLSSYLRGAFANTSCLLCKMKAHSYLLISSFISYNCLIFSTTYWTLVTRSLKRVLAWLKGIYMSLRSKILSS